VETQGALEEALRGRIGGKEVTIILNFFSIFLIGGGPYPLVRLRSTANCRLSRLYMLHYV
jgi:hypothetical protein